MNRWLAILIILVATGTASAQQKPEVSALEASGNKHFELAEYDAAIADFKEAFRVSDEPAFLFNIAQAYRLAKNCRQAATFYKTFLRRVPAASNAAKVRERIAEMDKCAETQPPDPVPTSPTSPTNPLTTKPEPLEPQEPETPPAPANNRGWMKWAGIGSLAAGALGVGLGIKFAVDGSAANDEIADKCATSCTSAEAKAIEDDGKAANRNAVIAGVASGVFVAAGVVLVVLSRGGGAARPTATEQQAVSFSLTRGSATAAYAWRF